MGFVPLNQSAATEQPRGFIPLSGDPETGFIPLKKQAPEFSLLKTIALENPATAIGETALNLGSQMFSLPVAGLAGLATEAGNVLGMTDKSGADAVHSVGEALTYQPHGEMGRMASEAVSYPFQKLAEAGQWAGNKTLEATGSPLAATAIDTVINAVPMALGPVKKGAMGLLERFGAKPSAEPFPAEVANRGSVSMEMSAEPTPPEAKGVTVGKPLGDISNLTKPEPALGFTPLKETGNGIADSAAQIGVRGAEVGNSMVQQPGGQELHVVRSQGDSGLSAVDVQLRAIPERRGPEASQQPDGLAGEIGRERELRAGERGLGIVSTADPASSVMPSSNVQRPGTFAGGDGKEPWNTGKDVSRAGADLGDRNGPGYKVGEATLQDQIAVLDAQRGNYERAGLGETRGAAAGNTERTTPTGDVARASIAVDGPAKTGFVPLRETVDAAAHDAATSPHNALAEPTRAQIDAGNYKKGTIKLHGLDIAVENPKGSIRAGVSPEGKPWQTEMQQHYGYVKRTLGKDGDPVDVFIGHKPESQRVFVVDQVNPKTGRFDEHKAILGADTLEEAKAMYHANYEPGWKGLGAITPMDMSTFKEWVKNGDTKKPIAQQGIPDMGGEAVRNSFAPGANYAPLVDDSRAATATQSVADLPAPIRREGIIKDLTKALDTTVYEGRVKGKNRLGFFRPKLEEVRTKRANDLEVAAHELAHLVDDRIPEIRKAWQNDKALAAELKGISYDQTKVYEGFAEGVRLWMTQPETLQAKAPTVAAWLDDFAGNHPYGPALKKAQADMTAWFGQDALNRARSKIGEQKPLLSDYFDRAFDKFRQSTVDDLHGVYQMERRMTGGKINALGPYETARLSRASASIADGAVRFGYPVKKADGSFTYAGKGLMDALKPVAEGMDDALLYFVGRSSRELMQQGREHLFTEGEIKGMLKLRTPERDAAFKDYQAWNKGVLDFAEAAGVINPDARAMWQRTQYLPFHRVSAPGTLKGKPGDWAGIKALTGGTENIKDVLGNMVANAAMLIDTAVKNEARLKVADLASKPGAGKFMVKIDPESRPVKISGSQVMDEMFKKFGIAVNGQVPAFFEFFLQGQPPAGGNVVAVLKAGKPTWYEVGDPILYRALTAIDRPPMHWLTKWLGMPKRLGQMAITLTPDFMLANIARDTIMGSVMSRSGFRPVLDSLQGMRLRMTNDPLYKDYIANGGGLSSLFLDEHHLRTKLEKFYGRQGIDYRTVLDSPDKLLSFVETLGDSFEMSTRLGEYKRAIDKGEHPRHAAYQGREVSTDFAMRGDSKALGFLYDTVMFLRPAVVSMDRLFRGVAHDPNKAAIGAKSALIALSSVGLYLLNREDPRYTDLPDWDRDSNWHFFVGDQHFRYPKIWEVGALASMAERTVEKLVERDPQGMGADFARIIGNTFNMNFKPQIVAPLYEQATNRNSFTGSPIETPSMENVQPFMRAKPSTSESMKALGMATRNLPEALQVNPVRTEALLRGYLSTWAAYGLMLSDKAFFDGDAPAMRADQMPVIRRFYSQEPPLHTKFETKFYDMLNESKRLTGTLKELDRMGRPEIADEKERGPMAGESKPLERASRNVQQVNAEMMKAHRNKALTPEEKRQTIDALIVEKNALLKATVKDAEAAQRAKR